MKDPLGDRIKGYYENRYKASLSRRSYVFLRIDGKAFHTYTKGLDKPFDGKLVDDMISVTEFLCANIQGAKVGYVQSDEISILLTDFDTLTTDAWFDYEIQKMVSVSASLATARFNELRPGKLAMFDSRVFTVPNYMEAVNTLIWRQQDAVRNSKSMLAQANFSHNELNKKTTDEMENMLYRMGVVWKDLPTSYKHGTLVRKVTFEKNGATRSKWEGDRETPMFAQDAGRPYLADLIPNRDQL